MANQYSDLSSLFTDIADSIREVGGTSASIVADEFPLAIAALSGNGKYLKLNGDSMNGDILVDFDKQFNLGSDGDRWLNIFGWNGYFASLHAENFFYVGPDSYGSSLPSSASSTDGQLFFLIG